MRVWLNGAVAVVIASCISITAASAQDGLPTEEELEAKRQWVTDIASRRLSLLAPIF